MDIKDMKELIRAVSESDITNFEYEDETQEIRIKKDAVQNVVAVQPNNLSFTPVSSTQTETRNELSQNVSGDLFNVVKSPLVGFFMPAGTSKPLTVRRCCWSSTERAPMAT